jgi:glycerol-3-phosphate acyltransferase PlsY
MATSLALIIFAYLLGSVPVGLLLGKCCGIDVRKSGSANIGATNVSRVLGKKIGLLTLVGDASKAILPMALAAWLLNGRPEQEMVILGCGGAAFLGHLFPVYLRFHGGKGVATALGIFLYLEPLAVLPALLVFLLVMWRWRFVSAGSLAATALMPVFLFFLGASAHQLQLAMVIAILIWLKHHANIGRLLRGEESKWGKTQAGREAAHE